MLVRIVHPTKGVEKIFVVDNGRVVHEIIKANVTLWINFASLTAWLKQFVNSDDLRSKYKRGVLRGNIAATKLPVPYRGFGGFKYKGQTFRLARFGCNFKTNASGHVEVKYETANLPSREVIINLHTNRDRVKGRKLADYNAILLSMFTQCFDLLKANVRLLMQLGPRGYSRFGFIIAMRSSEYYLNMMLHDAWLRKFALQAEVATKAASFASFVSEVSWLDNGWDYYPQSAAEVQLGLSLSGFSNCAHMDLSGFAQMFSPETVDEEVEDYGEISSWGSADFARGYAIGYGTSEFPCQLRGIVFAHADMRGLNLFDARFFRCDFSHADLRGARINLDRMDAITLITLARARLDADVAAALDAKLLIIYATHPRIARAAHDHLRLGV